MSATGPLVWNRSGWFGSVFGVSIWLLPFGVVAAKHAPVFGLPCGAACFGLFALGRGLWIRRTRITAHGAIQRLLAASAAVNTAVVLVGRSHEELRAHLPELFGSPGMQLGMVLVAPTLMLFFRLRESTTAEE